MKKAILTIMLIVLTALTGCSDTASSVTQPSGDAERPDSAMQTAYDTSLDVRTFTDGILEETLSQNRGLRITPLMRLQVVL